MATKFLPGSRNLVRRSHAMPDKSKTTYAGIEVALKTLRGVLISETGETITVRNSNYDPENLIKAVADLTGELKDSGDIKSVGLAIPGLVNRETDRVLVSTGL